MKLCQVNKNKFYTLNLTLDSNDFNLREIGDEVVLSKTVLSNFCPKQANEWIRGHMASLFLLFIAFLT